MSQKQTKSAITGNELAVGGQAVIEGVLMRGKNSYNISVRDPDGNIKRKKKKIEQSKLVKKLTKIPFLRGCVVLFDSMKLGFDAIQYSVDVNTGEEDDTPLWVSILMITFSLAIALFLFTYIPFYLPRFIVAQESSYFPLVEGGIKFIIFVGYLLAISLMKDIKRVFEYHGAEHKAVHCYEQYGNSKKLTAKNAQKCSRIHKRCGTTFLFLVVLVSIVFYTFIPNMQFWVSFTIRLLLLFPVAGTSYEILRIVPKLSNKNPVKWLLVIFEYPGLLLQYITTKEPSLDQLEVAIDSLKQVV